MALAFDAASTGNSGTNEGLSSISWTHPIAGPNPYLFVGVALRTDAAQTVSTITCNSTGLSVIGTSSNGTVRVELWGITGPSTGSQSINVVLSAVSAAIVGGGASYTGADQTGNTSTATLRSISSANGNSSTPSVTVTSQTGDIVQDAVAVSALVTLTSLGASQTITWDDADAGGQFRRLRGSYEAGAASVVMDHGLSAAASWASVAASLIPAAGGGGGGVTTVFPVRALMGVGR